MAMQLIRRLTVAQMGTPDGDLAHLAGIDWSSIVGMVEQADGTYGFRSAAGSSVISLAVVGTDANGAEVTDASAATCTLAIVSSVTMAVTGAVVLRHRQYAPAAISFRDLAIEADIPSMDVQLYPRLTVAGASMGSATHVDIYMGPHR